MPRKFMDEYLEQTAFRKKNVRKYGNLIEAIQHTNSLKKFFGTVVINCEITPDGRLTSSYSWIGLLCLLLWYAGYYYFAYKTVVEDQTIVRLFYDTKLQHYGDTFVRASSLVFTTYAMWKIPFDLNGSLPCRQMLIEIDADIEKIGLHLDYSKASNVVLMSSVLQALIVGTRILSVWIALSNLNTAVPVEALLQAVYSDGMALVIALTFCSYVYFIKKRYMLLNNTLLDIKDHKAWENFIFVRDKSHSKDKALMLQERYVCQKIKACARIYSKLYNSAIAINNKVHIAFAIVMLNCVLYIILNFFYFMEATASGLFKDTTRYLYFILYVTWQILYSTGVVFVVVYICEAVIREDQRACCIIHEIINSDHSSPPVIAEAMLLSQQLTHLKPRFTICGMISLDYTLLLQGAYSATTFLIILLQFVTD